LVVAYALQGMRVREGLALRLEVEPHTAVAEAARLEYSFRRGERAALPMK
jgi:hypothetical protein